MNQISIIKNFNQIDTNKDFESILEMVKKGRFRSQIDSLRKLLSEKKDKEYKLQKKRLPAFTPAGKFSESRKLQNLVEYSGIIVIDIDKVKDVLAIKAKAIKLPYTYACFISPSMNGLKIFARVETSHDKHTMMFNKLKLYYETKLGIAIDPSGKDISRMCFFSYDDDLYFNKQAMIFKNFDTSFANKDVEILIEEINRQKLDITSSYEDWCNIGFALESEFGELGRTFFHEISQHSPDYFPETCNDQYNKCLKNSNSGITIRTLFHYAKKHGIRIGNGKDIKGKPDEPKMSSQANDEKDRDNKTTNRFTITEEYLNEKYEIRYNVVSNKFEYKEIGDTAYKELNENNLFVKLQKDNINISLSHLIALLKSDFTQEYNPFVQYFENLPEWDGKTDYITMLTSYLHSSGRTGRF